MRYLALILLVSCEPVLAQQKESDAQFTKKYLTYLDQKKSAGTGLALWLLIPGAGPMYADNVPGGVAFLTLDGLAIFYAVNPHTELRMKQGALYVLVGSRLAELFLTIANIDEFNSRLRVKFGITTGPPLSIRPQAMATLAFTL